MDADLLYKNAPQPLFSARRKSFFITTTTPLRSRPTTTQSNRSANSASRVFSARRPSIFENESGYEERKIESRREARNPHDQYDKGTLEQLMRKRACMGVTSQENVMPRSFNAEYNPTLEFKDEISYSRNETGKEIVASERRNICANVTQPEMRFNTGQPEYPSAFASVMDSYENEIAVRLRDFYLQGLGHNPEFIRNSAKSNSTATQMYEQPEYSIFSENKRANEVRLRSAMYDADREPISAKSMEGQRGIMLMREERKQ